MIEAKLLLRRALIAMWIATAFTLVVNIYAGVTGNPILIGVGLGVALSYAIAGIAFGIFAARSHADRGPLGVR